MRLVMLDKEFVPYQESLELKELGFDEPCLLHVNHYGEIKETRSSLWMFNGYSPERNDDEKIIIDYEFPDYPNNKEEYWQEINIPTFSQAFRWFREEYTLYHDIKMFGDWDKPQFSYIVLGRTMTNPARMWHYEDENSYEEAELACLRKLIEIVKQQKSNHDLMSGDIVGN